MKGKLTFEEKQGFRGTWMWYLVIGIAVLSVGGTATLTVVSGNPDGYIGTIIATLTTTGVLAVLTTSTLHVYMDDRSIYYRYPPFINSEKTIQKEDIEEMYVRKYKAIREYGGYGYRFRFQSGRALNVAGDTGLQLVLKNGKKLLIGTQRPELMETAVKKLRENWQMNG